MVVWRKMEKQKQRKEDQDRSEDTKRATRKRPVLKEQNLPSDDSDFEDDRTRYRKAPSPVKNPKTKTKTGKMKGKKGKELEESPGVWTCPPVSRVRVKRPNMNNNLVTMLGGYSSGLVSKSLLTAAAVRPVIENVARLGVAQLVSPFDRRVTAIAWHPTNPHLAAAGSKVSRTVVVIAIYI